RAVAMALALGTAAAAAAGALTVTPAEAAVRAAVGKPLQAAQAAAAAGNYKQAMQYVNQAAAVGGLSAEERKIVEQMHDYISVKSGGTVGVDNAISAQAKFDNDYRSGRFRDAINDADLLRKYGALNSANMVVIAQAYYRGGDYAGCVRYAADHANLGSDMLELQARCAYETHDDAMMRDALMQLVSSTGKPQYWNQLLKLAESAKGLSDHQTLDIYRIKYMTGSMLGADDYFVLAQFALQFGFAAEAQAVVQKGLESKVLSGDRAVKLLSLAKSTYASNLNNLPRTIAAAKAAKNGDLLVKLGEDYWGMGRYKDAVEAVEAGIAKGKLTDPDNAQLRLGQAEYGAGNKAGALKAFAKSDGSANDKMTAQLWSLYVRAH
ncbi:MAG: hypothetical protein KJS68_09825, partial [Alphaproteobacteria bacterium]|nr:hypothetical protein [Alphaproteobacteria bacterium]